MAAAIVAQRAGAARIAPQAAILAADVHRRRDHRRRRPETRGCPRLPALSEPAAAASTSTSPTTTSWRSRPTRSAGCSRRCRRDGRALRPLPRALRLSIEADAALPPPARRSRAGDRVPARAAARVTLDVAGLPDRDAGRERAARRAARRGAGALVGLPARGDAAGARGVVGRDRRPARRGHRTGRRSQPAVPGRRLLPEQPVPAPAPGRPRRARGADRRRALPGRRLLRQRPAGAGGGAALRARARRRGQRQRRGLGARERRPQRARQLRVPGRRRQRRVRRDPVRGRRRRGHRRSAAQGLRRRVPRAARRVRAAHDRLRVVQPRDAGARHRRAGRGRLHLPARAAVRHVPADADTSRRSRR